MTTLKRSLLTTAALATFLLPAAFAHAATATIQNLSPGSSPLAKTSVTFKVAVTGFSTAYYRVADSFSGSSINSSNINFGGNFQWVPNVSDIGTHTLTVTVNDSDGNTATATQVITVLPPPSITIQSVSPGNALMPGNKLTFFVAAPGFSNPRFIPSDSFSGSSVGSSATVDGSGNFSWTPDATQNGEHTITIYASDTPGNSAYSSVTVRVGAGPTLSVPANVNTTLSPGQQITFTVMPTGYAPTGFVVSDTFSGVSTLSNNSINSSGLFLWSPSGSDAGVHTVTLTGQVGAYGQVASTTMTINVFGPNGVLPAASGTTAATGANSNVSALQAQLAALQAQLGGASTGAATASSGFVFTAYLKPGSESNEVTELQKLLAKLGFLTATPNGYFGPATQGAVKKFQAAHNLDQLGVVGPATRAALNTALGATPASTGATASVSTNGYVFQHFMGVGDDDDPDVTELQKRLIALKYMSGEPTGYYGAATEAAVKKFQSARGIPATGYVAKSTRAELNK